MGLTLLTPLPRPCHALATPSPHHNVPQRAATCHNVPRPRHTALHHSAQLCVAKQQLQLSTLRSAERALEDGYNDEVNADGSRIEYEQIDHNILCWQIAAEDGTWAGVHYVIVS